jgi:GNAT superfamily N-acetyltransferase
MTAPLITVTRENPHSAIASVLIDELVSELSYRYADRDDDEASSFSPGDVTVPRSVFVVARLDGVPVGCGALRPKTDSVVEIKRMYVRKEARGKGVARAVLAELEWLAAEFGYASMILETGIRQPEAIALYTAQGFVQIPNFGDYADNPLSVCYGKIVTT